MPSVKKSGDKRYDLFIQILAIILSFAGTAISAYFANTARETVDASRVEIASTTTNLNSENSTEVWQPWFHQVSERTAYIGLKRSVRFSKPFSHIPKVTSSLSLIDVTNIATLFKGLDAAATILKDKEIEKRLADLHLVTFPEYVHETDFMLNVGLGLPMECAKVLEHHLRTRPISPIPEDEILHLLGRPTASGSLTEREKWMLNFYHVIGTLNVSWLAQEKAS